MSAVAGSHSTVRCSHCGREVAETVHTRAAYRVDYYALHTGRAEPVSLPRDDDSTPPLTVWRLVQPSEIVTCVDCYRQPRIRLQREALFRPETAAGPEGTT